MQGNLIKTMTKKKKHQDKIIWCYHFELNFGVLSTKYWKHDKIRRLRGWDLTELQMIDHDKVQKSYCCQYWVVAVNCVLHTRVGFEYLKSTFRHFPLSSVPCSLSAVILRSQQTVDIPINFLPLLSSHIAPRYHKGLFTSHLHARKKNTTLFFADLLLD